MAKSLDKDGTLSQPAYRADITSSQSHMSPVNSTVTDNQSYISARKSSLTNNQSNTSPVKSTVTDSQPYISARKSSLTNNQSNMATTNSVVTDSQSNISARKSSLTINQSDLTAINASVTDSKSNITRKSSLANNQSNMGVIKSSVSQSNNSVIRSSVANNQSNMEIRSSVTNRQSNLSAKRHSVPNRESNILELSTSSEQKDRPQERYDTVTINKAQVSSQQVNTSADRINKTVERFVTPATETETLPMNKRNSPIVMNDPLHKTNASSTRFEYIQSARSGSSESQMKMTPINKCNIMEEDVNTTTYTATEIYGSPIDRQKTNASNYKTLMHKSQAQLDERPSATKNRRNSGLPNTI
ncbi:hypothetical protein DPMN_171242 [Dreissena polymorpha]|uniref:Uncharacterized protein n=1 Tax=Dreissena polymorpha TaxID=45954 RepID=A0A9D4DZD1_DREPO|nr:hypothetical protein DPMN_171242 [Dreissena polymorpha]